MVARTVKKLKRFLESSDVNTRRKIETLNQKGVSNWLTTLPIKDLGYELTKQEFWDAIRVRYDWPLDRIPSKCACGASFDMSHALSCKKGGFITLRHNEVRDITAELLGKVCVDVRKEPALAELNNEQLPQQANKSKEARLDISALNFWTNGQRAFFDVRVFNLFAQRHRKSEVEKCFIMNEKEKKKQYGERVMHASITEKKNLLEDLVKLNPRQQPVVLSLFSNVSSNFHHKDAVPQDGKIPTSLRSYLHKT